MRYFLFNDPSGAMAYLTTESPASRDEALVLAVRAGDVDGDFGPADLIYDAGVPAMTAAALVEVWASSPDRSDDEIEAARRFCAQWPEGPQVAGQRDGVFRDGPPLSARG